MSGGGGGGGSSDPVAKFFSDWIAWPIKSAFDMHHQLEWFGEWGVSRALYLGTIFAGLYFILGHLIPDLPLFTLNWLIGTAPIWLPIALWKACWDAWVWYTQALFLSGRNPILLEVKLPREVMRSPRAMELALTNFSISSGETTFVHRGWKGQVRPFFSMEIASFGGEIHFYFWCWKNYKNVVEAALYAHYPEIELVEVEDYATKFQFDPEVYTCFGTDWRLETYLKVEGGNGGFNINAYPFKSYVDFELDKDPKEELKVDPLANVLEFMGNIKPNEQIWIQIVFRKAGKNGVLLTTDDGDDWLDTVKHEVEKIRLKATMTPSGKHVGDFPTDEDREKIGNAFPHPTERQKMQTMTMERHLSKTPFEVGMRGVYITTGDLHGPTYTGLRWIWRPFGNPNFQTHLRPKRWHNPFDYPWQDIGDFRWTLHSKRLFDAYRRRSFFHSPWKTPTNIISNEALASIWHPPSRAIQTPGIERMPATKAQPPANLPR